MSFTTFKRQLLVVSNYTILLIKLIFVLSYANLPTL